MTKDDFLSSSNHWQKSFKEYLQFKLRRIVTPHDKSGIVRLTIQELEDLASEAAYVTAKAIKDDPTLLDDPDDPIPYIVGENCYKVNSVNSEDK